MALVVHGIAVVVHRVDAVHVIHVPVAVIVDAVAGDFEDVPPDVRGEVRMRVVDAGVDVADDDAAVAGGEVRPDRLRADLGEAPQAAVEPERIVRRGANRPPQVVGLHEQDAALTLQAASSGRDREAAGHANEIDVERLEAAKASEVVGLQRRITLLGVQRRAELHEQLAVHKGVLALVLVFVLLRLLAVDCGQ